MGIARKSSAIAAWRRLIAAAGPLAASCLLAAPAFGQGLSDLARVRSEIRRYGCHLPQYATTVAGCRELNARAQAIESRLSAASSPAGLAQQFAPHQPSAAASTRAAEPGDWRARHEPRTTGSRPGRGLFGFLFGDGDREAPAARQPDAGRGAQSDDEYGFPQYRTYRTLCVRLCDGYFWPISFSTVKSRFGSDSRQCESSCAQPAKLYYHRNPGAAAEQMIDLAGVPYTELPNAFRFRDEYVEACRCKPEPWSEAAKAEYEQRAQSGAPVIDNNPGDAASPQLASGRAAPVRTRYWMSPTPGAAPRYDTQRTSGWRYPFFGR